MGRRRARGHHRGSRPHDETPIPLSDPPPVPLRDLHGLDLPPAEKFAKFGGRPPSFEAPSGGNWRKKPGCCRAPRTPAAVYPPCGQHTRRSFSIGSASPPAASSFRGLSTWTATTRRRPSRCGPRRKTFRRAVVRRVHIEGRSATDLQSGREAICGQGRLGCGRARSAGNRRGAPEWARQSDTSCHWPQGQPQHAKARSG